MTTINSKAVERAVEDAIIASPWFDIDREGVRQSGLATAICTNIAALTAPTPADDVAETVEFLSEQKSIKVHELSTTIASQQARIAALEALVSEVEELDASAEHLPEPMSSTLIALAEHARALLNQEPSK